MWLNSLMAIKILNDEINEIEEEKEYYLGKLQKFQIFANLKVI